MTDDADADAAAAALEHLDLLLFPNDDSNRVLQLRNDDPPLEQQQQVKHAALADLFTPQWRGITLRLWGAWFGFAFGYYGTLLATTRVFATTSRGGGNEQDSDDNYIFHNNNDYHSNLSRLLLSQAGKAAVVVREEFDYSAIFISNMAELVGTTLVILVVDRIGRIPSQVMAYAGAGILLCLLCTLAGTGAASRGTLIGLGFGARALEMAATCVTWVSTAEILTTDVRATGHSAANAVARIGAFLCPFVVERGGNASLVEVGVVMLLVHAVTVLCVCRLPETKGREMGLLVAAEAEEETIISNNAAQDNDAEGQQHPSAETERLALTTATEDRGNDDDDDNGVDDADMAVHNGELS